MPRSVCVLQGWRGGTAVLSAFALSHVLHLQPLAGWACAPQADSTAAATSSTCIFYGHDDPSCAGSGVEGAVAVGGVSTTPASSGGGGGSGYKAVPGTQFVDMHCTKPLVVAADEVMETTACMCLHGTCAFMRMLQGPLAFQGGLGGGGGGGTGTHACLCAPPCPSAQGELTHGRKEPTGTTCSPCVREPGACVSVRMQAGTVTVWDFEQHTVLMRFAPQVR